MGYNPLASGTSFKGPSRNLGTNYQNGSGGTLAKAAPVAVNASSQLISVNVSNEATIDNMVGYVAATLPNAATGQIVSGGRLEDVGGTVTYAIGTPLWINFDGTLTDVKPDLGVPGWVAGMFVVFVGVVVKNEFDPLKKDLQLMTQVIGQL